VTNVSAADNLQIDYSPLTWQLRSGDQAPMVYADIQGLHYNERFATTRRLPATGVLTYGQILQVIAGYQRADESWHLGVVLDATLTEARGSRWCELAHWPDPDTTTFVDVAQSAGRGLATALNVPFRLVEPRPIEASRPSEPVKPAAPLPNLPLEAGLWTLQRANQINEKTGFQAQRDQLVFVRSKTWVNRHYRRMIWHSIWAIIYLWLSLVTIRGDTALPNAGTIVPDPHILPYMGVVIAFGFVISVFYHAYRIRTTPNLILVDPASRTISAWQGRHQRWSRPVVYAQSLYVSETTRQRRSQRGVDHGELNFYLETGGFAHLLSQGEPEPEALAPAVDLNSARIEAVQPLTSDDVTSSLQAMGLYVAQAFGLPAFYDRRVR
jgi:hypothetical protein